MVDHPVAGPATAVGERAVARVNSAAIEANCRQLRRVLDGAQLCAVVKAEGYGHGAAASARAALAGGGTWLAVATAGEAAALRSEAVDAPLLVMGALTAVDVELALGAEADLVAWSSSFVRLAAQRAQMTGTAARLHVKVDTGMGRLGTRDPDEALRLARVIGADDRLELAGLMTHFATADERASGFLAEQLERFVPLARAVKRDYPDCLVHAANSAATLREPASHFDMARCGIAVYGLDPFHHEPADHGLEPALRLESYVADLKFLESGATVGYGRTWTASRDTCIGVLPIGYGDGYRRGLSNRADVLVRGRRYPLVGTVSMDNVAIDLGPEPQVARGDRATLIGSDGEEQILAEELATALGTINYEVTCGLAARVTRVYHRGGHPLPAS